MKKFIPLMAAVLAPSLFAAPVKGKADLLATNTVIARFDGFTEIPCRHMTADCPDKCDHATKVANFTVLVNEDYKQPGKYGADKAEVGSTMMVDVKKPTPGQDDAAIFALVDQLNPGDTVRLTQDHLYIDEGCYIYPAYPISKMEKVDKPAAAPEVPAFVPATPIQPRMMPGRRAR
ncbi:MAG: hypothetical protein IKZ10_08775 [Akkermansia sp.]|nr:hypothetical protein [Akkermansia sp.]